MMKKSNIGGKMGGYDWEMRPGGMFVQKRNMDSHHYSSNSIPTIQVSLKFGSSYHHFHINSNSTFGELKKMLAEKIGLHPEDQKLIFKDKERESKSKLDACGVRDGSKIVLIQDIISQENKFLQLKWNSNIEKAIKSVVDVTFQVDQLIAQVTAMESVRYKGGRVGEKELLGLIELFMAQLIKLDGIVADGDIKLKRKTQVLRIQTYMEKLDKLKGQNATCGGHVGLLMSQQQQREKRTFSTTQINFTSKWEKY